MKIYSLKRMSIPKVAVLATGVAAALLVTTVAPLPAQLQGVQPDVKEGPATPGGVTADGAVDP